MVSFCLQYDWVRGFEKQLKYMLKHSDVLLANEAETPAEVIYWDGKQNLVG